MKRVEMLPLVVCLALLLVSCGSLPASHAYSAYDEQGGWWPDDAYGGFADEGLGEEGEEFGEGPFEGEEGPFESPGEEGFFGGPFEGPEGERFEREGRAPGRFGGERFGREEGEEFGGGRFPEAGREERGEAEGREAPGRP